MLSPSRLRKIMGDKVDTVVRAWDQFWEAVQQAALTGDGDRRVSEAIESLRVKWKRPTIEQVLALAEIIRVLAKDFLTDESPLLSRRRRQLHRRHRRDSERPVEGFCVRRPAVGRGHDDGASLRHRADREMAKAGGRRGATSIPRGSRLCTTGGPCPGPADPGAPGRAPGRG